MPEQWRDGIDRADGEIVCLTISAMRPGPGWLDTAWRLSREADAVGGAIEPGERSPPSRLGRVLLPLRARHAALPGPGDGRLPGGQRRLQARSARRDARRLSRRLLGARGQPRASGQGLPALAFARARRLPGSLGGLPARSFGSASSTGASTGGSAAQRFSAARNLAGIPAAVVVPFVLLTRTYREVFSRRRLRLRLVAATPLLLAYDIAWAVGEAAGHLDSLRSR